MRNAKIDIVLLLCLGALLTGCIPQDVPQDEYFGSAKVTYNDTEEEYPAEDVEDQSIAESVVEGFMDSDTVESGQEDTAVEDFISGNSVTLEEAEVPLASTAILLPKATGVLQENKANCIIDYSNSSEGYVMVKYTKANSKRLKVQLSCPDGTVYTYDLHPERWEAFPLTKGNGQYKVVAYENITGIRYSTLSSVSFNASLENEFAPYIRPNQYVNYVSANASIAKAQELTANTANTLDKVAAVYDWVVGNISYDKAKAQSVKSGYLPILDETLNSRKGICFDYAALMTGMLRSQYIPCKLIVGYAGTAYHAWISVYTESTGWIDNAIYFDGSTWHRMDPTFASTGNGDSSVMKYIGNGNNYLEKYCY